MKRLKSKAFILFITSIFLIQLILPVGIQISIGLIRYRQNRNMEKFLDNRHLFRKIRVSDEEFNQLRVSGGELFIGTHLYDVKSAIKKSSGYLLIVLEDKYEKKLRQFKDITNNRPYRDLAELIKKISKNPFAVSNEDTFWFGGKIGNHIISPCGHKNMLEGIINVPHPPPEQGTVC